ncbi:MAG TPA: DNA mismatch repair protein MutS [Candidatus Limnocylindrales bacterium]|nr:DNA mismatch repair protein MutS [Candidatus Limnocylindrales bacterium]
MSAASGNVTPARAGQRSGVGGAAPAAPEPAPTPSKAGRALWQGKLTPAMQQYLDVKRQHEDALVFFRMGDFYEMFFEDAEQAAELLDLTLTSRNRNDEHPIPMCGVPYHSVRPYVARLLEAGRKVAICEQLDPPEKGALVRREVTRIISPGTNLDEESLAPERANFLAALVSHGAGFGLAITDFSTGEVRATELSSVEAVVEELAALSPTELVMREREDAALIERLRTALPRCLIGDFAAADVEAGAAAAVDRVARGSEAARGAERAACQLLRAYVAATQGGNVSHLREPVRYDPRGFLHLDAATRRNLEILEAYDGSARGALVSVLDRCSTGMGRRALRSYLLRPLADLDAIGARLSVVEALVEDYALRSDLRDSLRRIGDLERLIGRIGAGTGGPRDVARLADALALVDLVRQRLQGAERAEALAPYAGELDPLPQVAERIRATLVDEPAAMVGKGEVIRGGFHEEVDRLRSISRDGKGWILAFEAEERARTGIGSLKVGFNKVFGYYIEITRANQHLAPASYTRKQTVANAERYITPELKARENEVLGAEERLNALEAHLLRDLMTELAPVQPSLGRTAAALAALDALAGLAEVAHQRGYVRPQLHESGELDIVGGRHPVVEARLGATFVPNDCRLGADSRLLMVITGPNMAGKSTYLRQVALIVLLAHCGSFVPATAARIPLVDRIFTRIGASDNLAAGQSTFMVEMSETAAILRDMTERSLVVLDEIGRGTSTFDGISIAWAVAEAMGKARAKTLFATHYHELAALEAEHDHVENFSVAVRRYKRGVIFLYRIVPGPTSGSFGIEVARLAGVPEPVIEKARTILARFESGQGIGPASSSQLSLFSSARSSATAAGAEAAEAFAARVAALDANAMTPLEALNLLARLVEEAKAAQ